MRTGYPQTAGCAQSDGQLLCRGVILQYARLAHSRHFNGRRAGYGEYATAHADRAGVAIHFPAWRPMDR